jgi:hypothetical protein
LKIICGIVVLLVAFGMWNNYLEKQDAERKKAAFFGALGEGVRDLVNQGGDQPSWQAQGADRQSDGSSALHRLLNPPRQQMDQGSAQFQVQGQQRQDALIQRGQQEARDFAQDFRRQQEQNQRTSTEWDNRLLFRRADLAAFMSPDEPGQPSHHPGSARDGTNGISAIASDLAG